MQNFSIGGSLDNLSILPMNFFILIYEKYQNPIFKKLGAKK